MEGKRKRKREKSKKEPDLDTLFNEVQAVKMLNLKRVLRLLASEQEDAPRDAVQLSQMVLKAVELQHKLLSAKAGQSREEPLEISVIWEALMMDPEAKALLGSEKTRKRLIQNLERLLEKGEKQ